MTKNAVTDMSAGREVAVGRQLCQTLVIQNVLMFMIEDTLTAFVFSIVLLVQETQFPPLEIWYNY